MWEQFLCCSCCPSKGHAEAQRGCLVQVWHQASIWAVQSQVQKKQSESYYCAVPNNNIYSPQHHLTVVILVWPGWTTLR